jgi:glutaredoxin 3
MSADVLIYLTSWCPYCHAAKELLGDKNVAFTEVDVDGRQELRAWLAKATGQRTVPQVFINGEPVGGFSDISALDQAGKLDPLLAAPPPPEMPALPR